MALSVRANIKLCSVDKGRDKWWSDAVKDVFELQWNEKFNSGARRTSSIYSRTCSPRPWGQQEKEFQDLLQLVGTHLPQMLHKSCSNLFPKVFRANQKKDWKRPDGAILKHNFEEWGSLVVLLRWEKMTVGVFGAQCAQCRAAASLRWFRPSDGTLSCWKEQMDALQP